MAFGRLLLGRAREMFRVYCNVRGLSPRTIECYQFSVACLERYLEQQTARPTVPTSSQIRSFVQHMLESGLSRQTIRVRMRSIRCFYNYLESEELVRKNPMDNVEIPRVPVTIPTVLTSEQVASLLKAVRGSGWHQTRNRAVITTFLDCGLRLAELVRLDLADLDLQAGSILVRSGKGSRDRIVFAGASLRRVLRQWIKYRGISSPCAALFITNRSTRIDRRYVQRLVEQTASSAGLGSMRVHPHLLRHTFATHFIKNGGDPFTLQRLLGHADIKTTMVYVNLAGTDLEEAHAKASPVDRLLSQ